jgi:carbon-monoxide dehydrogenase medium subunit
LKPAPFSYTRPASIEEAVTELARHDGAARVLAGGQSLVPMMHMRLIQPEAVVDVNRLRELDRIEEQDTAVVIGALTRYTTVERSAVVAARLPLLRAAVRHVGDRQVRNRGTVGGSLAHADPVGEVPLACLVLGASVLARGVAGTRTVAIEDFVLGPYTTALEPEELLVEIRFPAVPVEWRFHELCRRHNDFAVLAIGLAGERTAGGWCGLRVGIAGADDHPLLVCLEDSTLDGPAVDAAVASCLAAIDPIDDVRASAEYRRHLVDVHLRRLLHSLRA